MAQPRYVFELYSLSGVPLGEVVDARNRTIHLALNATPTASFDIGWDNPQADVLLAPGGDYFAAGDAILAVWRNTTLLFVGDCTSVQSTSNEKITCTFSGPQWRLGHRIAYPDAPASGLFTGQRRDVIISTMLAAENADAPTGIEMGTPDVLTSTTYNVAGKTVAEAIADLAPGYTFNYFPPASNTLFDDFSPSETSVLEFQMADTGQQWQSGSFSGAPDWTATTGYVQRTSLSDGGFWDGYGRYAWPTGTGFTVGKLAGAQQIRADILTVYTDGENRVLTGVYACATTALSPPSGDLLYAVIHFYGNEYPDNDVGARFQFKITVHRRYGGATAWELTENILIPGNSAYNTLALQVDPATGKWYCYFGPQDAPSLVLSGTDTTLASTGGYGLYDSGNGTAGGCTRRYTNVRIGPPDAADPLGLPFDYEIAPANPATAPPKIGTLNVKQRIGTVKSNVVFTYPDNVKSFQRTVDRDGLANRAWSLGNPDAGTNSVKGEDIASQAVRGLYETIVTDAQDQNEAVRLAFAQLNATVRKQAKQIITFEPDFSDPNTPQFLTDWILGDTVIFRATVNGQVVVGPRHSGDPDFGFRIYTVDITLTDEGAESIKPGVTP